MCSYFLTDAFFYLDRHLVMAKLKMEFGNQVASDPPLSSG